MVRILLILSTAASFLASVALASPRVPALPTAMRSPAPGSIDARLDSLDRSPSGHERTDVFYRLLSGLDRGDFHIRSAAEAAHLAQTMSRLMVEDTTRVLPWQAAEMMVKFPHPLAKGALLSLASRADAGLLARRAALEALVALREPRAFPLLEAELRRYPQADLTSTLRLIGELGDPRGGEVLRGFQADLHERVVRANARLTLPSDRIEMIVAQDEARYRATAQAAEANLRRYLEDHIVCAFALDDTTRHTLDRQGFAIRNEGGNELYEFLGSEYPCVTSDVAFHAFVLVARGALGDLDSLVLGPRLRDECLGMAQACARIARASPAAAVARAAWQDAAFFAVPARLLGASSEDLPGMPADLQPAVEADLDRVREHLNPGRSAVLGADEDFTKYTPRGRYSGLPEVAGVFQAVVWLGRANFEIDDVDALRRVTIMAAALREDRRLADAWASLDSLYSTFYGPPDDWTLGSLAGDRSSADLMGVAADDAALRALASQLARRPAPRINTAYAAGWQDWKSREHMKGVRVLGQRYTRTADLFQQLLEQGVWPPSGLHVAAGLLGSARASALARPVGSAPRTGPGGGIPEGSLRTLSALFTPDPRAPQFMHRAAWQEKQINTAMAGWAEVLNITAPFVKDANVYLSASAMLDRFHGWVEPVPEFYARLDSMTRALASQLEMAGMFAAVDSSLARADRSVRPQSTDRTRSKEPGDRSIEVRAEKPRRAEDRAQRIHVSRGSFDRLSGILQRLRAIADQERSGAGQSIDDGVFLKSLRFQFKNLAFNQSNSMHAQEPMGVVADPASEYLHQQCLEVGTGGPRAIYVAVSDGGYTFVCRGGVYAYHEFTQPIGDRLDDMAWRALVRAGKAPPAWMDSRPALRDPRDSAIAGQGR